MSADPEGAQKEINTIKVGEDNTQDKKENKPTKENGGEGDENVEEGDSEKQDDKASESPVSEEDSFQEIQQDLKRMAAELRDKVRLSLPKVASLKLSEAEKGPSIDTSILVAKIEELQADLNFDEEDPINTIYMEVSRKFEEICDYQDNFEDYISGKKSCSMTIQTDELANCYEVVKRKIDSHNGDFRKLQAAKCPDIEKLRRQKLIVDTHQKVVADLSKSNVGFMQRPKAFRSAPI